MVGQIPHLRWEAIMMLRLAGIMALGMVALATTGTAQPTPTPAAITRTVIATTKLPTVTEVPLYFRAVGVTLPPGEMSSLTAANGILYQVSGSTEVSIDQQATMLNAGEGMFIAAGRTATFKAGGAVPSTFLHFFLAPAAGLNGPAEAAPAVVRELYRTAAPIPDLKPGSYNLNLTRVTFPAQMPSNPPHHRSGAALYYINLDEAASRLSHLRCAGKHSRDTLGIDVESQESERITAGVTPLVYKAERLIDQ